jgi:hypothetical protein
MTDQSRESDQSDEGTMNDPQHDPGPQASRPDQQSHRPDPTQERWSGERTEQLPRADATQQLPTQDEGSRGPAADAPTDTPESVDTAVFGATTRGQEEATPAATSGTWPPPVPPRPTGPHAPAIVLGLICLAVAGIVMAQELGNLSVDWGDVGPLGFVAVGAVLVVLGAVGLVSSNRRSSHS